MPERVFVTGTGIISCLGDHTLSALQAMLSGKSGVRPLSRIESVLRGVYPAGEITYGQEQLMMMAGVLPAEGFSRNALLGIIAAREAAVQSGIDKNTYLRTGLISATTVGGMDQCEFYYQDFLENDSKNAFIDSYDCADSTEKIAVILGISDFVTTISTACSSAANALMLGARMIRTGKLDRVVAGGCESLTRFHLNGFNALKILDKDVSKPFDKNRAGINLGEGAAYLVLESETCAVKTGNEILCELAGWGNSCEAFHQTASSPDGLGPYLAMKQALEVAGLTPEDIVYINAHGTGTDNNDLSEGLAIQRLFGSRIPHVSSTKPFTGHTTSAAGSAEAILSVLSIRNHLIWPNLNFNEKIPELDFEPVRKLITDINVETVMSNSFGFGGNDTSLVFRSFNSTRNVNKN